MRLTEKVHNYLEEHLQPGDLAIDATAGNGHDCLKIAQLIAPNGRLIAVDRQSAAITASRHRLSTHKLQHLCEWIEGDHGEALQALGQRYPRQASAIVFNLGYLPGGDKSIQTEVATTQTALKACTALLKPSGILLVTAYRGHPGGMAEAEAVAQWMHAYTGLVQCHEPEKNAESTPPILWVAKALELDPSESSAAPDNRLPPGEK